MLDKSRIISEDTPPIGSKIAQETLAEYDLCNARDSFWFYRQVMNPRFTLKGCWFPRTMARELRRFYDSWRAGKRPVLLLSMTDTILHSTSVVSLRTTVRRQLSDHKVATENAPRLL